MLDREEKGCRQFPSLRFRFEGHARWHQMFALILPPQQNNTSISHSLIKRRALRLIHPIAYFQSSFNRTFYFRRSLPNTNRANRIYASIFKGRAKAITNVSSTDNAEPAQRHPDSLTNEEGQCAPEGGRAGVN